MKKNSIFFVSASTSLAQGVVGDPGTLTPLLPEGDASAPGIYIRRQGSKAEKIVVR